MMNARGTVRRICAIAVALITSAGGHALADDAGTFRFRGAAFTATGSHVERHLTWSARLPFDKTFAELSAAQLAYFRDQYDGLAPDEEPPYPQEGMRAIVRLVDRSVDQIIGRSDKGPLVAVAKVDDQGVVTSVSVFKSPGAPVTAAISYALMNTPFKPARRNGAPVAMDYVISVELL
jgi:hypothetical protein